MSTAPTGLLFNPLYLIAMGAYLAVIFAIVIGLRIYHRRQGGAPPISFEIDGLSIPLSVNSRRVTRVAYADVLSAVIVGKGKRANLILDTPKRAFVYPVREFADGAAAENFIGILHGRIAALDGAPAQLARMSERAAVAAHFGRTKPWATWGLIGTLILVFLIQTFWLHRQDSLGLLDMGANAASLVRQGEWYRLITANLLHAGLLHILSNGVFALVMGTVVERQLGMRRFVILVLATGILSQAASALWAELGLLPPYLFSVGISGALFGILGAQAVLNRRFGTQLPGGYRFAPRVWWIMLGLNFGVLPFVFPGLDNAAHVGGLASGVLVGWLLCRGQSEIVRPPVSGAVGSAVFAALGLIWIAGIGMTAAHGIDPVARAAERTLLIKGVVANAQTKPAVDNDLAWTLATSQNPTSDALDDAAIMARRAVANGIREEGPGGKSVPEYNDTLATVAYRRGDYDAAIGIERLLADRSAIFASQYARFLAAAVDRQGGQPVGDGQVAPPALTLEPVQSPLSAVNFTLRAGQPLPQGAEIYALIEQDRHPRAVLRINLIPVEAPFTRQYQIHLRTGVSLRAEDLQGAVIRVLRTDGDCRCTTSVKPGAMLFAYASEIADLP